MWRPEQELGLGAGVKGCEIRLQGGKNRLKGFHLGFVEQKMEELGWVCLALKLWLGRGFLSHP